jgi:hypothetical protein
VAAVPSANAVLTTTLAVCGWIWLPDSGQRVNSLIIWAAAGHSWIGKAS